MEGLEAVPLTSDQVRGIVREELAQFAAQFAEDLKREVRRRAEAQGRDE